MKRILSIILTIAMLLSSMGAFAAAYPADKANAYVLDSDFASKTQGDLTYSIDGATNVTGMYGKAADDVSGLFVEGTTAAYYYLSYNHGEPLYMDNGAELDGKLVVEYNFKAVNNDFNFAQIAVSQRQRSVSEQIRPSTSGYNPYGWNHVKWVYDPAGHGDFSQIGDDGNYVIEEGAVLGTTVTYLNGVQMAEPKTITNKNTDAAVFNLGATQVLIQIYSGDKENEHSAYIDDIKIYKDAAPAAPVSAAIAAGNTYTVSGTEITATAATTAADIAAANPSLEVAVYKNVAMTEKLAEDAQIDVDNYVVAKSADGLYATYRVADPMEASYIANFSDGVISGTGITTPKFKVSTVTGFGGKPSYDASIKLDTDNESASYDSNAFISFASYTNDGTKPYYVIEYNYYPETAQGVFHKTLSHADVAKEVAVDGAKLVAGKWNKVLMYVDYSGESAVSHLFINGIELTDRSIEGVTFGSGQAVNLRLGYNAAKDGGVKTAYLDDLKIYETNVVPTAAQTAAPKLVSNDKVEISGNRIKTDLGTTVADLETDVAADVYAYTADGVATEVLTGDVEVVVIGKNAAIGCYTVNIAEETNELITVSNLSDLTTTKTSVVRANTEAVTGFGGKEATDESIKFSHNGTVDNNSYTWYTQNDWGTVTPATDTTAAVWDKADYVGYFVYEANIYNVSMTVMQLATNQGQAISGNFGAALEKEKWNKVVVVVDETGGANDGKAIAYVNGEVAADWRAHNLGTVSGTTLRNNIRLVATGIKYDAEADTSAIADFGTAYLDDIKIYETTVMPQVKEEEAVTGIIADGTPSKFIRGVVTTVPGFAGKAEDNEVSKIVLTEDANENTAYSELTWSRVLEDSKYIVLESDIYSESNYGGAYYATSQHSPLGGNSSNATGIMGADKWNRYVVVLDIENGYTADVYVNGVFVEEATETSFMTTYNDGKSIRNLIRTVYPLEQGDATYLDNYKVYETNVYPEIAMSPVAENGIYANGVLTDNYLYVKEGTTVDDAAAILGKGAIVYTDNTFTTEELGSAEVYNGLVAAIIDAENDLYYSRKIVVIDEVPALDVSEFVILGEGNSTMEPVTVVANLAAGDVFVMKQDTVQNVIGVDEAGEQVVTVKEDTETRKLIIAEEDGIEIDTIVPQAENGKLRAFMFDNLTSIRPLGGQTVIDCPFPVVEVEAK